MRQIESRRVQWRMLIDGSTVWAPFGEHGWRAATVLSLGKNRGDNTVVHLAFETGGKGRRVAGELFWRKTELKGKDKPTRPTAGESLMDVVSAAAVEMIAHARRADEDISNAPAPLRWPRQQ